MRPQSAVLIELGKRHHLFHDPGGDAYARVPIASREAVLPIASAEYRDRLGREFYGLSARGCNRNALADAVSTLTAVARFDGPEEPVYLRVAETPDGIALDLGDATGEAVLVDSAGWRIAPAPVNFRRSGKPLALPRPANPDFARLWHYVNVTEADRPLVAAWLLAALRPRGPYPLMLLIGEKGAGKTGASRVLKRLVDPSVVLLRPPPREERDLQVATVSSWCVALDNLSGASPQLSDCLCRVSTGGGFAARRLYTDSEEVLHDVQRPMILNGIEDIASRPDLADRCLHLLLPALTDARPEADLESGFRADAPAVFAALLDGLSVALRDYGRVRLPHVPRMADFATWAAAGLLALGFTQAEFLAAYSNNRAHMEELALDASPVASALVRFMDGRDRWEGGREALLRALAAQDPDAAHSPAWPRSAKGLANALRRVAPALRNAGLTVVDHDTGRPRTVEVCRVANKVAHVAPETQTSATSATSKHTLRGRPPVCPRCLGEGCDWCRGV